MSLLTHTAFSQDFQKNQETTNSNEKNKSIKIKTFETNQGWGFDILVNNKIYIHQTNIPAVSGQKAFKTKKDALKIAKLMQLKMQKNIFPPSITLKEIDSLISKK